jgi:predicted metalloprotease
MNYSEGPDTAFSAICAHEFGHILQYKHGIDETLTEGQPTMKKLELHADFLAGYFAGLRKLEKPNFKAAVYADTQHKFGDFATGSPDHHGTPEERADAIVGGFKAAFNERRSLNEAVAVGIRYVSRK